MAVYSFGEISTSSIVLDWVPWVRRRKGASRFVLVLGLGFFVGAPIELGDPDIPWLSLLHAFSSPSARLA